MAETEKTERVSGTHEDVFSFQSLTTHAIHYKFPADSEDQDYNYFGTSTFFVDYYDVYREIGDALDHPPEGMQIISPNNELNIDKYYEAAKYKDIYIAWKIWFQKTKQVPDYCFFDYKELKDIVLDKNKTALAISENLFGTTARKIEQINIDLNVSTRGNLSILLRTNTAREKWQEDTHKNLTMISPLAYFPPNFFDLGIFENKIFFDAKNPQTIQQIMNHYQYVYGAQEGAYKANLLFNAIKSKLGNNAIVRFSDIIKQGSSRYGFVIDWSNITGGPRIDLSNYYRVFDFEKKYIIGTLAKIYGVDYSTKTDTLPLVEKHYKVFAPEGAVSKLLNLIEFRDQWICYWLNGGYFIPLNENEIILSQSKAIINLSYINKCVALKLIFPTYLKRHEYSIWEQWGKFFGTVLQVATLITGAGAAIMNKQWGEFTKIFINTTGQIIKAKFPQAAKYVDAATIIVIGPILKKTLPKSQKVSETTQFLMNMMKTQIDEYTYSKLYTETQFRMSNLLGEGQYQGTLSERNQQVVAALSDYVIPASSNIMYVNSPRVAANIINSNSQKVIQTDKVLSNEKNKNANIKKDTSILTYGALALGGALVLNKLLGKKKRGE